MQQHRNQNSGVPMGLYLRIGTATSLNPTYEVDDVSGRKVLLPMVHAAAGKFQAPPLMM